MYVYKPMYINPYIYVHVCVCVCISRTNFSNIGTQVSDD